MSSTTVSQNWKEIIAQLIVKQLILNIKENSNERIKERSTALRIQEIEEDRNTNKKKEVDEGNG